jgi:hypothetical protein
MRRPMKRLAWSAGFVVLAVVAAGDSGCSITVDTGDDGGTVVVPPGDDEGQAEASAPEDAGATDDGGTCAVGVDSGNAACDACIESSCCGALVACDGEPIDDAGETGTMTDCEEIIGCYNDCIVPPADSGEAPGSPGDCTQLCSNGHTQQGATDFKTLQMCLATRGGLNAYVPIAFRKRLASANISTFVKT